MNLKSKLSNTVDSNLLATFFPNNFISFKNPFIKISQKNINNYHQLFHVSYDVIELFIK